MVLNIINSPPFNVAISLLYFFRDPLWSDDVFGSGRMNKEFYHILETSEIYYSVIICRYFVDICTVANVSVIDRVIHLCKSWHSSVGQSDCL